MDWGEGGRLIANPPWTDDTVTGAYGAPTVATADKGRQWLKAAVDEKIESIDEVLEQQRRRERRRREQAALPAGGGWPAATRFYNERGAAGGPPPPPPRPAPSRTATDPSDRR